VDKKTTGDYTLDWMYRNLPPEQWNLRTYVEINWCADLTVADVLKEAELIAELPEELYPEPVSKLVM
jgi:hypothetical protein